LYITHKGRFCVLAELILLRSFRGVLSRPEGTRFAATVPLIISIDSITFYGTHRLKKADILRSEMEWLGSVWLEGGVGIFRSSLASSTLAMSSNTPNTTLYIKNLNDSINKEELRAQLYALFLPYGTILDVVALKTAKMRGQAFVVFADLASATTAMRSWDGESFYDKPMVSYYPCSLYESPRAHHGRVMASNSISSMQRQSHGPR
jgi:hypothetical protein